MDLLSLLLDPRTASWLLAISVVYVTEFHAQIWLMPTRVSFVPVQCALLAAFLILDPAVLAAIFDGVDQWPLALWVMVSAVRYVVLPVFMLVVVPYCWYTIEPRVRRFAIVRNLIIVAVTALLTYGVVQAKAMLYGQAMVPVGDNDTIAIGVIAAGLLMILDSLFVQRIRVAILGARTSVVSQEHDSFLIFSVVQLAVLCFTLIMAVTMFRGATFFIMLADALAIVCLLVDMIVAASMSRELEARRYEEYNALLQERLDVQLDEYEAIAHHVKAVARRRHDLRNQLGVIDVLVRRGDFQVAAHHVDALQRDWQTNHDGDRG